MLSFTLAQPSFALLKLASLFGALPLDVNVSTGELNRRNSACYRIIYVIHYILSMLKLAQLVIAAFKLSKSVEQSSQDAGSLAVVLMMIAMMVTALVFRAELVGNDNVRDDIVLLSPLRRTSQNISSCIELEHMEGNPSRHKRLVSRLVDGLCRMFALFVLPMYKDFVRLHRTFTTFDVLTIICPAALVSVLPVVYLCIVIGEPEAAMSVFLLNSEMKSIAAWRIGTIVFDFIVATFIAMNLQLGIFNLCALLAIYTHQLRDLSEMSRFEHNGVFISSKTFGKIWTEIRRLAVVANLINFVGANCVYAGKIFTFACSVLGTFYILRFGFHHFISFYSALLAFFTILFYNVCLGKVYVWTELMDKVLQNMKMMPPNQVVISKRELRQRIQSVRPVGIMEGGYRLLSRETSPEFLDFYVNQVIALFLTFK